MNENVSKWVAALRSGEYGQARGRLREGNRFCCLGVACDVYMKETGRGNWLNASKNENKTICQGDDGGWWFGVDALSVRFGFLSVSASAYIIPTDVVEWYGLAGNSGEYSIDKASSLANDNDVGVGFEAIAGKIETTDTLFA